MRFLTKRRVFATLGVLLIAFVVLIGIGIIYVRSVFDVRARQYIVEQIEKSTGARVELGNIRWSLWRQRFVLEDLTLRGLEPAEETPLAHISRIEVGVNLRTLLQKRIDLFELTILQPEVHLLVSQEGKTNFPSPQTNGQRPLDFKISIQNFNVIDGSALINEQRLNMDFSVQNLDAMLDYQSQREVLKIHLGYDGVFDREPDTKLSIPYTLTADVDYTRATIIAQQLFIKSGGNQVKLQGRINQVLGKNISGKLAYTTSAEVRFLNYFFPDEKLGGKADAAGFLEFADGYFSTQGNLASDAIDFDDWHTMKVTGEYTYKFPERLLTFRKFKGSVLGGSASGEIDVDHLPGPSRITLNLNYSDINALDLARVYPWDPKYRIVSTVSGKIGGWFEGKFERYDVNGHADLKSLTPSTANGVVPLPLDGSLDYQLRPREARVSNGALQLYSTAIRADGLILPRMSDLKVNVNSGDLKDLSFLYADANGSGSFDGTITGDIAKPLLNGEFRLQNHKYKEWTIQLAAGGVRLDTETETASFKDVRVTQGDSFVIVNGSAALSGSPLDLRVQSNRVTGNDLRPFVQRNISGTFAGEAHITALSPSVQLEGDLRAENLSIDNETVGNARAHVRYFDPIVELSQAAIEQTGSTVTGSVSFDRTTEALRFNARVNSVDLQRFYRFGLPRSVEGLIRQADLQGQGTTRQPNIIGNATLQNLKVSDELFPQAQLDLTSSGNTMNVGLKAGRNLDVAAQINTAVSGYPFNARVNFTQYPLERIAKLQNGTITATGTANLSGNLNDQSHIKGSGRIETATIQVQKMDFQSKDPFTFEFDPNQLRLNKLTLSGQSTLVNITGTVGLTDPAPLKLDVDGQLDLGLIAAEYPGYTSSGTVNVQISVGGTLKTPDVQGSATLNNASLSRSGIFASIAGLSGKINFDRDRITVSDFDGQVGGGRVHAQGTAFLRDETVQGMNIVIDATDVRLRGHPEGLRTVVNGNLILSGGLTSPLLEGNVRIQSLAFRSNFEDFLAVLAADNLKGGASPLDKLRLSLHIEGGRNITIQNQLATVEARVDIDWKGTVDQPSITGHIEASGGTLTFQGYRYTVTRGNIDFIDPFRIQPVIDLEAESQIRDYRVILSVTGKGNNPKLALRSEPPLPELEIVSLMAGGRTREEIAEQSNYQKAPPTSEQVFQSGAASILSDLLQQRVGSRLGLLNGSKLRFEPFQVGAQGNTSTRITLSQQVTKDLSITYSQDLSSNRQQVITIEYFVTRDTSVVATRDELGNLGLDVRHRTRIK